MKILQPFRKWAIAAAAVMLAAFAAIVIAGFSDDVVKSDVALVLGTKVELDGTPGVAMQVRCNRALELYRDGMVRFIIASGGTGVEGFDEASVMKDYLVKKGVPAAAVIPDSHGVNTYASARNAREIMNSRGWRSVIAVSQYYHVPRARLALRRFGLAEVHGAHARYIGWRDLYAIPREAAGWVSYWFRDYD